MNHPRRRREDQNFWTAKGVIPRWQLLAVYALVIAAIIAGWQQVGRESNNRAGAIQEQRRDATFAACRAQNDRHDDTIRALDMLLARAGLSSAQRRQSRTSTVLLIDALAPKRDCVKVVRATTGG